MPSATDGSLLIRVGRGDAAAFAELVRRWETPLYRFLTRVTGSPLQAEEVRQATFVRAFERASTFRGGSAAAWLFRIAHRSAMNSRRADSRVRMARLGPEHERRDPAPEPGDLVAGLEERDRVRSALGRLDGDDGALLWLKVAEGLTYEEIGAVLGAPASTLRYRFVRALRRLRRELGHPGASAPRPSLLNGGFHAMP